MSDTRETLTIRMAGKDHQLSCQPEDAPGLAAAAHEVESRVQKLRKAQPSITSERALALAALDIAFESAKSGTLIPTAVDAESEAKVQAMNHKLDQALARLGQSLES